MLRLVRPGEKLFDIHNDGVTVWVNGPMGLLGRFGRNGIDIHRPMFEQAIKGECLFCTHEPTTRADWVLFQTKMREHFDITVPDKHMPKRFQ